MPAPFKPHEPIYGVAVDQGSGLAAVIAAARGADARDDDLQTFKRIVVETASPQATTLLVDSNYGPQLLPHMAPTCIPMLAFEADVYHIADEDRITRLPDNLTVEQFPALGAPVLKFFLYYGPNDPAELNKRKFDLVRSIGDRCRAQGTTFLFEPIVYDRAVSDGASKEYALLKPELVRRAVEDFVNPDYKIDILKIEIPVTLDYVEGFGTPAMSRRDAEAAVVDVSNAAGDIPFVYLSAGVTYERFVEGLKFCKSSSGEAAGFMCGRALWSDAIGIFGSEGANAMARWMETTGRDRLAGMSEAIA